MAVALLIGIATGVLALAAKLGLFHDRLSHLLPADDFATIATYPTGLEAELAKQTLAAGGVAAFVWMSEGTAAGRTQPVGADVPA